MANRLFSILRLNNILLSNNVSKSFSYSGALIGLQEQTRQLYSKSTLGIDGFIKQKEFVQNQMSNISEKFKEKIEEYCTDINKNMIFSEDLKNMIHLATTNKDIEVVVKMIKKYNQQNKQLRFGNYVFGPVVMRLFYVQNSPDLALECFKSPELQGFFDQLISYQILLDLLYENQRYQDILDTMELIKERQLEGHRYPKNVLVLALAACYKMNTKEVFDYALTLWKDLLQYGHLPMRRTMTFFAGLALNQGEPGIALEVLTHCKNQNYTTVRNIKVAALARIGRFEHIVPILKSILTEDVPSDTKSTFNKDVIEGLQDALRKLDNAELVSEINSLVNVLQKQGNISEKTLEEQLCQEIQKPAVMNNRQLNQRFRPTEQRTVGVKRRNQQQFNNQFNRPGLHELV